MRFLVNGILHIVKKNHDCSVLSEFNKITNLNQNIKELIT